MSLFGLYSCALSKHKECARTGWMRHQLLAFRERGATEGPPSSAKPAGGEGRGGGRRGGPSMLGPMRTLKTRIQGAVLYQGKFFCSINKVAFDKKITISTTWWEERRILPRPDGSPSIRLYFYT